MKHVLLALSLVSLLSSCGKGGGDSNGGSGSANPTITIADLSRLEGTGGSTVFNVTVKLSAATSKIVTVQYSTTEGTAKAGSDYTAISSQTLTFAANETQKDISVSVVADDIREADEEFRVSLSTPVNSTIGDALATVVIRNDDTKIAIVDNGTNVAPTSYAGYTLAWSDEFNGTSLDASAWTNQDGDGCPGICGWGNNELEWYTGRPDNLFFQDGKMVIEAKKESYSGKDYTSSKILSANKKSFKFGRIDFRAKLPTGKGIWPAFWMLPQSTSLGNWPTSGEIDIMEMVGNEPNRTHGTLHYGPGPGSIQYSRNTSLPSGSLSDDFHVYSLEWKQDQIKWLLDGNVFATANKSDLAAGTVYPFNEPFYFIINLAVGGNWPGNPDATTVFPQWYIIDYVRVYQ